METTDDNPTAAPSAPGAEGGGKPIDGIYRTLFHAIDQGFCVIEVISDSGGRPVDYRYLEVNPAFARHTGFADAVGRTVRELLPDHEQSWFDLYGGVVATGGPARFEKREGAMGRWFDVFAFRMGGPGSRKVAAVFTDITARKLAETGLRESEERFRAFVTACCDVVYRMNSDWSEMRYLDGRGFLQDTHASNRTWIDQYIHPDDQAVVRDAIRRAIEMKSPFELEHRVIRMDGTPGWSFSRAIPMFDANGEITEWFGAASDVTDRREVEECLRRSEARYRTLFDAMDQGYCIIEMQFDEAMRPVDYRFIEVNGSFERQTGMRDAVGRRMLEFVPAIEPHWLENYGNVALTGNAIRFSGAYEGLNRWFDVYAFRAHGWPAHHVAVLFSDITRQRQAESKLRDADRRKDEFLATLAHELRNPLAPLRNGLELMKLAEADPETAGKARMMMERQLGQMVRLIDDLMDMSRISLGKVKLRKVRVPLAEVLQQAIESIRPLIDERRHHFTVAWPRDPVAVEADPARLSQVFSNLLSNAAKYTEPAGNIHATIELDGQRAIVRITDDGIGIPPERLPDVFDIFMQLDRSLENAQGGLGIGLYLVRQLVEMHGGRVEVRSPGHGKGCEFAVALPVVRDPHAPSERPCSEELEKRTCRQRILVADDNLDAAISLAMLLDLMGHDVRTAADGQEAVEIAADFRPDMIMLDIGMPRLNGIEACRRIRSEPWGPEILLVALTGWGQENDKRQTGEAGFDRHIVKPVSPETLNALLAGLQERNGVE